MTKHYSSLEEWRVFQCRALSSKLPLVFILPYLSLLLKEFEERRGQYVRVNHVGLPCERLAAGVWQNLSQRISAMMYPGVTRTTIYH